MMMMMVVMMTMNLVMIIMTLLMIHPIYWLYLLGGVRLQWCVTSLSWPCSGYLETQHLFLDSLDGPASSQFQGNCLYFSVFFFYVP